MNTTTLQIETARELDNMRSVINNNHSFAIVVHKNPDGDAVGSGLGLANYLISIGKEARLIVPNNLPRNFNNLHGYDSILNHEDPAHTAEIEALMSSVDVLCNLDHNKPDRTGTLEQLCIDFNGQRIMIDHHREPMDFADAKFFDIHSCSTCALVADLIIGLEGEDFKGFELPIAKCLYTGIVTDTGNFRFRSVNPHVHRLVATLLEAGIDVQDFHENMFNDATVSKLKLWGVCTGERLNIIEDGKVAFMYVVADDYNRFDIRHGDTEGLVNRPLEIGEVKMSALFKEEKEGGKWRISFRSKETFNVSEFSKANFNGGGHLNAAGGAFEGTLEELLAKFKATVPSVF